TERSIDRPEGDRAPADGETKTAQTRRSLPLGRLISWTGRMAQLFFHAWKIVLVGRDRPFFRPEVLQLAASIRLKTQNRSAKAGAQTSLQRGRDLQAGKAKDQE